MVAGCASDHELRLRVDDLSWRLIENEIVAVDIASSTYLSANPSGALLWQMLADGTTRRDLIDSLVERFGIAVELAEADADAFVANLESRGLLER